MPLFLVSYHQIDWYKKRESMMMFTHLVEAPFLKPAFACIVVMKKS